MIFVGIDDTDVKDSRGTNQLARTIVKNLSDVVSCVRIIRHQLLQDPRVPCTSKNGSASLTLIPHRPLPTKEIASLVRRQMEDDFIDGSDPGLCVTDAVPPAIQDFGLRSQREFMLQSEARELANEYGLLLEGLGGTEDGVIGALAAVGLVATENDGRIVQLGPWSDDVGGVQSIEWLQQQGLEVRDYETGRPIETGRVDVGKKLRPNRRDGKDVLFVEHPSETTSAQPFVALKLP